MRNLALLVAFLTCGFVLAQNEKSVFTGASVEISDSGSVHTILQNAKQHNKSYTVLSFENIPGKPELAQLRAQGIELLGYAGDGWYHAELPADMTAARLANLRVNAVAAEDVSNKISNRLFMALEENGGEAIPVGVVFYKKTNRQKIAAALQAVHAVSSGFAHRNGTICTITISKSNVFALAENPAVASLDLKTEEVGKLNFENRLQQRVNVLHGNSGMGRGLEGAGVCVGVGDGGDLGNHIDFESRVFSLAEGTYQSFGAHGDHVSGIIGSAGNLNPKHKGMAPKCNIITQKVSDITEHTEAYFNDYGMVLTNNSYGVGFDCFSNGIYNYTSQTLDWQMREFDKVLHVFAAGNSGNNTCEPYPAGYKTVIRYYQSAKNVLTVGNVDENRVIANNSSRGPVADGRLKPEICGIGRSVVSTGRHFDYFSSNGTSMSSPSITGTLVLLNERYRQLNDDVKPDGGLLKAIACNTAEDLGNPGPDYIYGFGLINGRRAVETIEQNRYFSGELAHGEEQSFTIHVPEAADQLKVMLYWHDVEAESQATSTLINNLDLSVEAGNNTTYLPWILNPNPEHVADNAIRGVDDVNNIEQVTISNIAAGDFEVKINATMIPEGVQKFYLVYDIIHPELVLTFPNGGESIDPGTEVPIHWDTEHWNRDPFSIDYSNDNGATWEPVATYINYDKRSYNWTVPDAYSANSLIRVTKKTSGVTAVSAAPFMIMQSPEDFEVTELCDSYISLKWRLNENAVSYNIYMFDGDEMQLIDNTSEDTYLVGEPMVEGNRYWFAVQAVNAAGQQSERCVAISAIPTAGAICPWENDLSLHDVEMKRRGRALTSSALGMESVNVNLRNVGFNAVSNFPVYCRINGEHVFEEQYKREIAAGDSTVFTFSEEVDFSQPGEYLVESWVTIPNDVHNYNDSLLNQVFVTQLDNAPVLLDFVADFAAVDMKTLRGEHIGPPQLEQWDIDADANAEVSVKTFDNIKVLAVGGEEFSYENCAAILNLNLSNYQVSDKIMLDMKYFVSTDQQHSNIYVRGSDTESWLLVKKLEKHSDWQEIQDFDLSVLLAASGQSYSTSFQVKLENKGSAAFFVEKIKLDVDTNIDHTAAFEFFEAFRVGEDVSLSWKSAGVTGAWYELELASSYEAFQNEAVEVIGIFDWEATEEGFKFLDESADKTGSRYYRVRLIYPDGVELASSWEMINFKTFEKDLTVYPNPFQENLLLHYNNKDAGVESLEIYVYDVRGILVKTFSEKLHPGKQDIMLDFRDDLPDGFYTIRFRYEQGYESIPLLKHAGR